jgi:pimeloyl-ACP methyl ester carboxylesterase
MRKMLWALAALVVVVVGVLGSVLAFDSPVKPPPLATISKPFEGVDFSDLPAVQTYPARDGAKLGYRAYEGGGAQVIVLIHGSSDDGSGIHPLARALRDAGASVYVPVLRGHGNPTENIDAGRNGDIGYIGQLEDDLADFVKTLRPLHANASFSLVGFSSGGGFVLRVIGAPDEKLFDRFIMISPALPQDAPTIRPSTGGWVSVAKPRIIALVMLNRLGIDWFNGLPIVAFATPPTVPNLTSVYSFRLAVDFGAPRDYLAALGRSKKPAALLVGGSDELFFPDAFAPLFKSARPDLPITIVPGIGHIGMTLAPAGIAAVRKSFLDLTAPAIL